MAKGSHPARSKRAAPRAAAIASRIQRPIGSAAPRKVLTTSLKILKSFGAPQVLLALVFHTLSAGLPRISAIDWLELFAGDRAVTQAHLAAGLAAVPFERKLDPVFQDFLRSEGYNHALQLALALREGGGCNAAPATRLV